MDALFDILIASKCLQLIFSVMRGKEMIEYSETERCTQRGSSTLGKLMSYTSYSRHAVSDLTWRYHCFRVIHIKGCHIPNGKPIA
jgi:hypothetical protein